MGLIAGLKKAICVPVGSVAAIKFLSTGLLRLSIGAKQYGKEAGSIA
ncbi:MAG: hypothetical protein V1874_10020 [Spirochaetota bacterium]